VSEAVTQQPYPVPPEELRWRAAGTRDAEAFLASGSAIVEFLDRQALAAERKSLADFSSILDFGCGCGRVMRWLRPAADQWASVHGTDIDPAAIAWCKQNIADASFALNADQPPLSYPDKSMDLACAVSVFSHFDAGQQFRWLAELQRIVKPGGYLLITFRHREGLDAVADPALRDRLWSDLDRDGMAFASAADTAAGPSPSWYGDAWRTPEYVHKAWGSYFEVCHIHPAGAIPEETAVLRARESTFLQRLFQRPGKKSNSLREPPNREAGPPQPFTMAGQRRMMFQSRPLR
jgi:SAM-dependent methyltransferase